MTLDPAQLPAGAAQAYAALQAAVPGADASVYEVRAEGFAGYAAALLDDSGTLTVHVLDASGAELATGLQRGTESAFTWAGAPAPAPLPQPTPALDEPKLQPVDGQTPTYQAVQAPLFDADGPGFDDIDQGGLGDCFFLSSLSSLAQRRPDLIQRNLVDHHDGMYTVTLYQQAKDGSTRPVQVTVDNQLPESKGDDGKEAEAYASSPGDRELWVSLYEKAYAEFRKGYTTLDQGGNETDAMSALTGQPAQEVDLHFSQADQVWGQLQAAVSAGKLTTAGTCEQKSVGKHLREAVRAGFTKFDPKTFTFEKYGMVEGHAYTVLGVGTDESGQKYVQLRNPWGNTEPGSDGQDDGVFRMPLQDFAALFDEVSIGD